MPSSPATNRAVIQLSFLYCCVPPLGPQTMDLTLTRDNSLVLCHNPFVPREYRDKSFVSLSLTFLNEVDTALKPCFGDLEGREARLLLFLFRRLT
jgi:hypothetical protein